METGNQSYNPYLAGSTLVGAMVSSKYEMHHWTTGHGKSRQKGVIFWHKAPQPPEEMTLSEEARQALATM